LESDPTGHLLLLLGHPSTLTRQFQERIKRNVGENYSRILFLQTQSPQRYFQYLAVSTAVLDSPIYACGISGYDAFSFGVPCVTQTGELLVQRYTSVLYDVMEIDGPKTSNQDEYVAQAVKLGTDQEYRAQTSRRIRERSHLVFEDENVVKEWERFMKTAVESKHA
jgi:predicted O-linked N-acetylglucosamine transferase (SPINDLY family)